MAAVALPASRDGTTASSLMAETDFQPHERLKDDPRTNIETPHILETPLVVAATENPRHVICERDRVRAKSMSGEQTPDGSLAPIHHGRRRRLDVHRIRQARDRANPGERLVDRRCTGRLGDGLARGRERGRARVRGCGGRGQAARGATRRGVTRS